MSNIKSKHKNKKKLDKLFEQNYKISDPQTDNHETIYPLKSTWASDT